MQLLILLTLLLGAVVCASPASANLQRFPGTESPSVPIPLYTAIYTTTLADHRRECVIVGIVTILTPREEPLWPEDGVTVVGAAISNIKVTNGSTTSTWAKTRQLTWTLSGNSDSPRDVTPTPTAQLTAVGEALTSSFTSTSYLLSTTVAEFVGSLRQEWFFTTSVTFVEVVRTWYPTTIMRTGYTTVAVRYLGANGYSPPVEATATSSYWRTTTMVQITATGVAP